VLVVIGIWIASRRPPQMGADEQSLRTVDALYTAVRNRDLPRIAECEQRLHGYRDAGKLPSAAADFLNGVIAKGRAGDWETAADRLYEFMLAQRREGEATHTPPKRDPKAKPGTR